VCIYVCGGVGCVVCLGMWGGVCVCAGVGPYVCEGVSVGVRLSDI